jgi:DnaJ-domain-containing protein 1
MNSSVETPVLKHKTELWKARAQAKQRRLEQSLAQPPSSDDEAAWRMTWIMRALKTVKRAQAEIQYQAALMDAYAEHVSVLEMTLISAAEQRRGTETPQAAASKTDA